MRRVLLALTLGTATLVAPRAADACSCIKPPGPVAAAKDAGAVFEAKILSKESFERAFEGSDFKQPSLRFKVQVLRVWKGGDIAPSGSEVEIVTADNSAACGRNYEMGETYLIYAMVNGNELNDGLCSRTMKSSDAAADFEALGEATGNWEAPEGAGDDGAAGEDDGGPQEPAVNPFERDSEPSAEGEGGATEPPPAEGSKRGCSVAGPDGGSAGSLTLLALLGLGMRRRRDA